MIAICERAIVARINRKLSKTGERLRVCRESSKWFNDLGRYYMINDRNVICAAHIDLEQWNKQLAVK